jgi:hypothetical protein
MTKSLETADHVLKLTLASAVIICYLFKVISGPLATVLFLLAAVVVIFFVVQLVVVKFIRD